MPFGHIGFAQTFTRHVAACGLAIFSLLPVVARAQDNQLTQPRQRLVLFPSGDLVPVYVADPYRPNNVVEERFHTGSDIADTSGIRTALAAGGRFGILKINPSSTNGWGWQVSIDAGLDAVFDAKHRLDGIGWDGNYGLSFSTASAAPWSFRFAIQHLSAHVGDEYQDRTGHHRRNYRREEIAGAVVRRLGSRSRTYLEIAGAYITPPDSDAPWRVQWGIEHEGRRRLLGDQFTWYAAADLQTMEERHWRLDTAVEGGLVAWRNGRAYRIGTGFLKGRSTLGEFSNLSESFVSLFLKIDM